MMIISDALYHRHFPYLEDRLKVHGFGNAVVHRALYSLTSGTAHSAQYALAAMFKAACDGTFNFVEEVKEYGEKARIMKNYFWKMGLQLSIIQIWVSLLAMDFTLQSPIRE